MSSILIKRTFYILMFFVFLATQSISIVSADDNWKNWYGIVWNRQETIANRIRFIRAMGYDYIAISDEEGWNAEPSADGLKFYFTDPFIHGNLWLPYTRSINTSTVFTEAQRNFYNTNCVWKNSVVASNESHLATGSWASVGTFATMWDFQQQPVIDSIISKIIIIAQGMEGISNPSLRCAGFTIDTCFLHGNFRINSPLNQMQLLSDMAGTASCVAPLGSHTHQYATYDDGLAAFYKQLKGSFTTAFGTGNDKMILEPTLIYGDSNPRTDEWMKALNDRSDASQLVPDMMTQESWNNRTDFVDNVLNFPGTLSVTRNIVGVSQRSDRREDTNRVRAIAAATATAWYNWYGNYSENDTDSPAFNPTLLSQITSRYKLIKCIPNWDNLAQMGTPTRSVGNEYGTISYRCEYSDGYPRSIINNRIMYSRPYWDVNKIYVAIGTTTGTITINSAARGLIRAKYVNEYFEPIATSTALVDFELSGDTISWKSSASIDPGSWTGYILEIGTKGVSMFSGGVMTSQ